MGSTPLRLSMSRTEMRPDMGVPPERRGGCGVVLKIQIPGESRFPAQV
jgi:hypothetical protein